MSWAIVLFNSTQKIASVEEIEEELLVPIDFNAILEKYFTNVLIEGNHREILGETYSINYFIDKELASNLMLNLYGEDALFALIPISKKYGWQIFDTGNGEMIDLDNPEKNGYKSFQNYLSRVLNKTSKE